MEKIGIFCSASGSIDPIYFDAAHQIGEWMGKNGKTLIYGGANLGLMECVAKAVKENGGHVIGVVHDSYTHLRAHETSAPLVCRLLL